MNRVPFRPKTPLAAALLAALALAAGPVLAPAWIGDPAFAQARRAAPKPAPVEEPAAEEEAAEPAPAKGRAAGGREARGAARGESGRGEARGARGAKAAAAAGGAAAGAGALEIGKSGAWGAYTSGEGRAKVCYAGAEPAERTPKGAKRGKAYVFVSLRPAEGAKGEVSVMNGFEMAEGSLAAGGASFPLLAKAENAWPQDAAAEARLVEVMRRGGGSLVVKGTSKRGTATTDTYPLSGFNGALALAQKACS